MRKKIRWLSGYRLSFLPARSGVRRGPAILSGAPKAERKATPNHITNGNLEQYSLSAISALAERAVTALVPRGGGSPIGDRFDAWPASARSFARCHTESTRERTQAGAAAIRSS